MKVEVWYAVDEDGGQDNIFLQVSQKDMLKVV